MNRLTKWNGSKYILPQGKGTHRLIADRLAEYEDTGLEPEQIKNLLQHGSTETERDRRIFISGPISNTDDYMERFEKAEINLKGQGYLPINPTKFSQHLLDAEFKWDEFMDVTIALLKQCRHIYMLPGWENSRGAIMEYRYAIEHKLIVISEKGDS